MNGYVRICTEVQPNAIACPRKPTYNSNPCFSSFSHEVTKKKANNDRIIAYFFISFTPVGRREHG